MSGPLFPRAPARRLARTVIGQVPLDVTAGGTLFGHLTMFGTPRDDP